MPKYEKTMSRLADEALKETEKEEKKTRVRGSVDDYTRDDWKQVAKKVRFNEKAWLCTKF